MKKLMGLSLLVLGLVLVSSSAQASSPARGAKGSKTVLYTLTVTTVSLNAGVIYSVICSTPTTAGDYLGLFDTNLSTNVTSVSMNASPLKTKVYLSSSTSSSLAGKIDYDPPLQFSIGIMAALSAAANSCLIVWEPGHVVQGY